MTELLVCTQGKLNFKAALIYLRLQMCSAVYSHLSNLHNLNCSISLWRHFYHINATSLVYF